MAELKGSGLKVCQQTRASRRVVLVWRNILEQRHLRQHPAPHLVGWGGPPSATHFLPGGRDDDPRRGFRLRLYMSGTAHSRTDLRIVYDK